MRHPSIQMIVGLGNPGAEYHDTRHNAGAWFVNQMVEAFHLSLRKENKFFGDYTDWQNDWGRCRLLIPNTFMNHSGQAIKAVSQFYKIPSNSILVAHDELDLPAGDIRLKQGGGHAGHNGLRDTINQLGSNDFPRLRIGIGHPGHRDQVHDYVLSNPTKQDKQRITIAITATINIVDILLAGDLQKAMKQLHTKGENHGA